MVVTLIALAVAGAAGLYGYRNRTKIVATAQSDVTKVTAFAKTTEIEGKLIALRAVAAVKKEEAKVVHAALDETNKVL
jgi:hypothetical protein